MVMDQLTEKKLALCLVKMIKEIRTQSSILDLIVELAMMDWLIKLSMTKLVKMAVSHQNVTFAVINLLVQKITTVTVISAIMFILAIIMTVMVTVMYGTSP